MKHRATAFLATESLVVIFDLGTAYLAFDAFGLPLFVALGAPLLGLVEAAWLDSHERYAVVHPFTGLPFVVLNVILHTVHGWSRSTALVTGLVSGMVLATSLAFPVVRRSVDESRSRRRSAAPS